MEKELKTASAQTSQMGDFKKIADALKRRNAKKEHNHVELACVSPTPSRPTEQINPESLK